MVAVHANADSVARYRELLLLEWTRAFPEQVLALLWATLGKEPADGQNDPLLQLLDPGYRNSFPADLFQSIVRRISEGTKFVRLAGLPALPSDCPPPRRLSAAAWQANRLATYLTLPAHVPVTGDLGFFADLQALAFQAAIHVALPALREKYPAEHSLLLHSAVLFALGYAAYDPAQYAYLMSAIHGYLGDEEQRLRTLHAAFRFTPPEDHSYLTKAQEFWSELIDAARYKEAEDFLLSLPSSALPSQQEEVREMVVQAFGYLSRAEHEREGR